MNDVIHEIISMSNDETIYDQYKNSEIKDNNETNDVQNDKSLDTKNKSDDSRIVNENNMSNITVNTEIDNNKDSDNDKPIDVADINANKEKLKSVNKRLLNKQMYNNKILDAITPISHNINNKLGQEVMTCDASSDISPVNAQNVNTKFLNTYTKSFKFTKMNIIVISSIVICIMFIFAIVFITKRNKTTKFDIISNTNDSNEHDTHDSPDYSKDYKQFGTKINDGINININGGKKSSSKVLPKRDNKGRFIKSQ